MDSKRPIPTADIIFSGETAILVNDQKDDGENKKTLVFMRKGLNNIILERYLR